MQIVKIDRAKWARGRMGGKSALLNSENNMCCLGFACLELGATQHDIFNKSMPYSGLVPQEIYDRFVALGARVETLYSLALTNDDSRIKLDRDRLDALNRLLTEAHADLRFEFEPELN